MDDWEGVQVPELSRLARDRQGVEGRGSRPSTLRWAAQRPTEAVNLLIKKVKRVGHGFRNFDNYRLPRLLYCGVS